MKIENNVERYFNLKMKIATISAVATGVAGATFSVPLIEVVATLSQWNVDFLSDPLSVASIRASSGLIGLMIGFGFGCNPLGDTIAERYYPVRNWSKKAILSL